MTEKALVVREFTRNEIDLIKDTVAKGATDDELKLFLYIASQRQLNPLTRQVYSVPYGNQRVIQTSIDGFRLIAERTGKYMPSPKPTAYEYKNGKIFSATVFGMKYHVPTNQFVEFNATAIFDEYKVDSNSLWRTKPHVMLEKCAEAKMLRRGFPEELSGLYTPDEMGQATAEPAQIIESCVPEIEHTEVETTDDVVVDGNPYAHYLENCPEHHQPWHVNKFSRHSHKDGTAWCNLKTFVDAELAAQRKRALLFSGEDFNAWLKGEYNDKTWSKLADDEHIEALAKLRSIGDSLGEKTDTTEHTNPLVQAAVELGAEVKE